MKGIFVSLLIVVFTTSLSAFSVTEKQLSMGMEQQFLNHYLPPSGSHCLAEDQGQLAMVWVAQDMGMDCEMVALTRDRYGVVSRQIIEMDNDQIYPSLVIDGDTIYLVYANGYRWDFQICLLVSHDFGSSWENPIVVSDGWDSANPVAALHGSEIYVTWLDGRGGHGSNVYLDQALTSDLVFGPDQQITTSEQIQEITMASDDQDLAIAYFDSEVHTDEPYVAKKSDGFTPRSISGPVGYLRHSISCAMFEGEPYVSYVEITYWQDEVYLHGPVYWWRWMTPRAYSTQVIAREDGVLAVVWSDVSGIWVTYSLDRYSFSPEAKAINRSPGDIHAEFARSSLLLGYGDYINYSNEIFGAFACQ